MESSDYRIELLEDSWRQLQEWATTGKFNPETEADIQCFLFKLLLERLGITEQIHAELPHKKGIADLVVNNRIFIEIIYILGSGERAEARWNIRTNSARAEIGKLQALREEDPSVIGVLAVFAKTYMAKDESWYCELKRYCDEAGIRLLRSYEKKVEIDGTFELSEETVDRFFRAYFSFHLNLPPEFRTWYAARPKTNRRFEIFSAYEQFKRERRNDTK